MALLGFRITLIKDSFFIFSVKRVSLSACLAFNYLVTVHVLFIFDRFDWLSDNACMFLTFLVSTSLVLTSLMFKHILVYCQEITLELTGKFCIFHGNLFSWYRTFSMIFKSL